MNQLADTIQDAVLSRIRAAGRGKISTPKDFLDLGGRAAVDQSLSRLTRSGHLQRLGRGLYLYPRKNPRLGITVAPDPDEVADAIGRQTGSRLIPSGATAANRLGLSTQVPAKPVYLSDGRTRRVRVGGVDYHIKHASPRDFPAGSRVSAMVFQALRYLGKQAVSDRTLATLRAVLSARQRQQLLLDARYATDWIAKATRLIGHTGKRAAEVAHG